MSGNNLSLTLFIKYGNLEKSFSVPFSKLYCSKVGKNYIAKLEN